MNQTLVPDYLLVGHVTKDNTPQGPILGGTCSYSGVTAYKLAQRVAIVTRVGPDIPSLDALAGIEIEYLINSVSTTFENVYQGGVRHQKLLAVSEPLSLENVPPTWRNTPIVHLAPIAQEISPAMSDDFPNSLICATIQGWLRGRDSQDNVIYQPHPELDAWLSRIDILVMSLEDVLGDKDQLTHFLTSARLGVETLGPRGCLVYYDGQTIPVPVEPAEEVDPTGAGDIFAAAFFIQYHKTRDFIRAAQFANACASMSVRRVGVEGSPSLAEVERRVLEMYHPAEHP